MRKLEWLCPPLPVDGLGRLAGRSEERSPCKKAGVPEGTQSDDISAIFGSGRLAARERLRNFPMSRSNDQIEGRLTAVVPTSGIARSANVRLWR